MDVINSAVFNGGFLTGGAFFDYREVQRETDPELFAWRDKFNAVCAEFGVKPAAVCVQFRETIQYASKMVKNGSEKAK